jgi:hypothetical protein
MRAMPFRAALLTLALTLLAATPARAAFEITAFELTPSTKAAGAHADVTIATSFTPFSAAAPPPRPRNVTFHLAPGISGDPFAAPRCSRPAFRADSCPAATRVGSVAVQATALVALVAVPQSATGDLYNLEPAGSEPARLGAVIRPLGGLTGKLFVPTVIRARAGDGGLDSIITDLPTTLGGTQIYTERMAFTLEGRPAGASRPFMRNPTSCRPARTTVVASSYGNPPAQATASSEFTPTDCGALAFTPHIEGAVGAPGATALRAKPPVRTAITQPAEQANQASATVTLPPQLSPDLSQLARACGPAALAARACPDRARVGIARATTPLLAAPLTGSVYLAQRAVGELPGLTIQLADPIPVRLDGTVALTPQGVTTTFTGLPDVPLARFELNLDGGAAGLFGVSGDLCRGAAPPITAAFAAQSGARASETRPMTVTGCTPPPHARGSIRRLRTRKPTVRIAVRADADSPDLTEVMLLLPSKLDVRPRRARRGVRATADGSRLPRSASKLSSGTLSVQLPAGTRRMTAKLFRGAVRAGRRLARRRKPPRMTLRVLARDTDGPRPAIRLKVRPRRR